MMMLSYEKASQNGYNMDLSSSLDLIMQDRRDTFSPLTIDLSEVHLLFPIIDSKFILHCI